MLSRRKDATQAILGAGRLRPSKDFLMGSLPDHDPRIKAEETNHQFASEAHFEDNDDHGYA